MDTKITSTIWSNLGFDPIDAQGKLAAFWLLTNELVNVMGFANLSERRFVFETQLPLEALAKGFDALGKGCVRIGNGYWLRNYIGSQIGRGPSLSKNNYAKAVTRLLMGGCQEELGRAVLTEYPELLEVEGFISPWKGLRGSLNHKRREERRGEEQSGADVLGEDAGVRQRMLSLNRLFNRRESTAWSVDEKKCFKAAGLDSMPPEQFATEADLLAQFYGAVIPEALARKFWRRTELVRVLRHWPGELDRAIGWNEHAQKLTQGRAEGRL
jgi:hypothetical protein